MGAGGGGGVRDSKIYMGDYNLEDVKCHVALGSPVHTSVTKWHIGQKSVTYYLNGPLHKFFYSFDLICSIFSKFDVIKMNKQILLWIKVLLL
jgi:hypothetical protein